MKIRFIPRKLAGEIQAPLSEAHALRLLIAKKLAKLQGHDAPDSTAVPLFSDALEAAAACLAQMDKSSPFLECRESISVLSFLMPVTMALKGSAAFLGTGRLPDYPLYPLSAAMEQNGCTFHMGISRNTDRFKEICTVEGRLCAGDYILENADASLFAPGLLFALPLLEGSSTLSVPADYSPDTYLDMTLEVLTDFGIKIDKHINEDSTITFEVPGRQTYVEPAETAVEGDWLAASFWLTAGCLSGNVSVSGLNLNSAQPAKEILNILAHMDADINIDTDSRGLARITARACSLQGFESDVSLIPDLAPVISVLMSFAEGTSMITHIGRSGFKGDNLLKSIYAMLFALNADISYGGDRLSFTGSSYLDGGNADSRGDCRIAMAAAAASCLCSKPVILEDPIPASCAYTDFYNDFIALGGEIEQL